MAHPKHRHSKERGRKRRTHYKAVAPTLATCSNCGAPVVFHHICPECGYYRGKQAIVKAETA
jgi:large subunit ribosomal protein L32